MIADKLVSHLAILLVIAHPDDETLYVGLLHAMVHKLNATLDLCCVTNGEGGYRYSQPSESLYGLKLSDEIIARAHLPRIRKAELQASGKILGVRKYFYLEQKDLKYSQNIEEVFLEQWDQELVIKHLSNIILTGNNQNGYDIVFVMLPNPSSHGHHSGAALSTLNAINLIQMNQTTTNIMDSSNKIPIILGASEFSLVGENFDYSTKHLINEQWYKELVNRYPLSKIDETSPMFTFNRTWRLSNEFEHDSIHLNYHLISIWMSAEHKTQGSLIPETRSVLARDIEQYFYFQLNHNYMDNKNGVEKIEHILNKLKTEHNISTDK
ncbi:unnamed protein product [Didymodactylos carnosus]|uniref:N-acetylglucosaminylphosphatidylinositol deacetylase n=1 Tax=Didymodactylos carnosus TaxID=1234261 RepID=A0A815KPZ5_9BILA|nr:unnamed protein product [Didymodactylos carnosus]CAF1399201.1 unnamed protein product [Didymodactylos carnosus]CAF3533499.1 unnamed protein product [Didymodactylos carnosus]CAF4293242.1 unnamed protein product [Didymodactylos carnosus]